MVSLVKEEKKKEEVVVVGSRYRLTTVTDQSCVLFKSYCDTEAGKRAEKTIGIQYKSLTE